jgi:hypothetical protein
MNFSRPRAAENLPTGFSPRSFHEVKSLLRRFVRAVLQQPLIRITASDAEFARGLFQRSARVAAVFALNLRNPGSQILIRERRERPACLGGFGRAYQNGDFAAHAPDAAFFCQRGKGAAKKLFVELGHFARQNRGPVAERGEGILQHGGDAVRRFKKNQRMRLRSQRFERPAAFALFGRQKSDEEKALRRKAGGGKRGSQRRRPGNRDDRDPAREAGANQMRARIGKDRHPRIAHQRHARATFERFDEFGAAGDFVVLVQACQPFANFKMAEKLQRLARVFAGYHVRFFQEAQGAQRDVLKIADGCGDDVYRSRSGGS